MDAVPNQSDTSGAARMTGKESIGSADLRALASIQVDESGRATVLAVAGEIDLSNQGQFRAAVTAAASSSRRLVVDLTRVTALSSCAIGVLTATRLT